MNQCAAVVSRLILFYQFRLLILESHDRRRQLVQITTWAIAMTNTQGCVTTMRVFSRPAYRLCSAAMRTVIHIAKRQRYIARQKCLLRFVDIVLERADGVLARPFVTRDLSRTIDLPTWPSVTRFAKLLSD